MFSLSFKFSLKLSFSRIVSRLKVEYWFLILVSLPLSLPEGFSLLILFSCCFSLFILLLFTSWSGFEFKLIILFVFEAFLIDLSIKIELFLLTCFSKLVGSSVLLLPVIKFECSLLLFKEVLYWILLLMLFKFKLGFKLFNLFWFKSFKISILFWSKIYGMIII